MGKGHRHIKHLKSEKAKVKLKAKKAKQLPKGQNVTNPSFKVKKIVILEQLKQHSENEILSRRKLNVKDLLTRLQHHNSTIRQDAIRELKDILLQHSSEVLNAQFSALIQGVTALSLDKEKDIRRDSLKVLSLILSPISAEHLAPFCDVLISYLKCAMTHINPRIKEDSLFLLDVLFENCGGLLATHSHKVLPSFLDMISRLQSESNPGRQLTITLNSRNTSIKWRTKVLERLCGMFRFIVSYYKSQKSNEIAAKSTPIRVNEHTTHIPIFKEVNSQMCEIEFTKSNNLMEDELSGHLNVQEFQKYVNVLMPLMFDSWLEACPEEKIINQTELIISDEAALLLKIIIEIIQSILEYIDILNSNSDANLSTWFRTSFQNAFTKNLMSKFPYNKGKGGLKLRRRQEDFSMVDVGDKCLEENFALCQIFVWFTSVTMYNKESKKLNNAYCNSILEYLNDRLDNWDNGNTLALQQLIKVLRTLFLKASKTWYANGIDVSRLLQNVAKVCFRQPKRELQTQLFIVLGDITLDNSLLELHSEDVLKTFVLALPNLLLQTTIHESTIQMINKVTLRYRKWIQEELISKHDAIIENAKKIEIVGFTDQKQSRLTICNLFYFLNGQIYY